MKYLKHHFIWLFGTLFLLSGCFTENTPEAITKVFWQAVISNDVNSVIEYSNLTQTAAYDGFSQDWRDTSVSLGKIIIDADQASIVTSLTSPGTPKPVTKKMTTYLVLQNEEWLVDYERTKETMRGDLFSNLFGQLGQLGEDISQQLNISTDEFSAEMDSLSQQFEELANSISKQASQSIDEQAVKLRNILDELAASIELALKEQEKNLTTNDKKKLTKVANDLHRDSENLKQASIKTLAEGSKSFALAKLQLEAIDNKALEQYKKQWREWANKFETDMQNIIHELNRSSRPKNDTII